MSMSESTSNTITLGTTGTPFSYDPGYQPTEFPNTISIRKAVNGFIITIGCKTLVAEKWGTVVEGLELYWENPQKAMDKYCKKER